MCEPACESADAPPGDLRSCIAALIAAGDCGFADVLSALRKLIDAPAAPAERRLRLFLRHLLFLLESGDELYADCVLRSDDRSRPVLIAHRIAREAGEGVMKTQVRLALWPLAQESPALAEGAFAVHSQDADIVVHRGPVRIEHALQDMGVPVDAHALRDDEIDAFYAYRKALQRAVRPSGRGAGASWHADARDDGDRVAQACAQAFEFDAGDGERIHRGRPLPGIGRASHPLLGASLHVLPRLLSPAGPESVLKALAMDLPEVAAAGFDAVLLGVVDRQSTDLYYVEGDDGALHPYLNNHGYWSSGERGVDPVLGDADDYIALRHAAAACGLSLIQDSVLGTMGYPPQLPRLAPPASRCTPLALALADQVSPLDEPSDFLSGLESCDAIPSPDGLPLADYIKVVTRTHLGEYYQLPRPNLFDPQVRERVLARAQWQIGEARVSAFRVDMAKHLGLAPLRAALDALREAVRDAGAARFFAVLEYWSLHYRDLRFALSAVGPSVEGLYLYDFPLAHALQQALLAGGDWSRLLPAIAEQRRHWQVPPCCLVPIVIDHDPSFRPIFNGTAHTRDLVVTGLALALAMSANGPSVYCGYDDRRAAPAELDRYFDYSEQHARKAMPAPLTRDPDGPGAVFARLLEAVKRHRVLADWDGGALTFEGDAQRLRIVRTLVHGSQRRVACFCVARDGGAATAGADGEQLVFASGDGPSVALFVS
ncbi:hypothetical protein [Lysobacter capsici]|uniref:hypothetical protein n=1 Tax=Lysobacter capsici TaxID=435897 RepID=UPI00287BC659|nr:hypothetical protein [Lysobacter capsici]WND83090.1 hypothetical protein RJ610_12370 [Lysobacter capsici]WND88289.1 hypothetical protein RJ609_12380 [Lysobacter capsici]